jgi:hypothetical protein
MQIRRSPRRSRASPARLWRCVLVGACLVLPGGCANGDFGRVRPSLVSDDTHAWLGPQAARAYNEPASSYPLTDDERRLRDLAYPLIEAPFDRQRWDSVIREYGVDRSFRHDLPPDRSAYSTVLMERPYRSATARYSQLIEDARNDSTRIWPFFDVARRVIDMDHKRGKSLAHVSALSPAEEAHALRRINENTLIVLWVQRALHARAESYRFALERLVIATPAPVAVEAERVLTQLLAHIAEHHIADPTVVATSTVVPVYPPGGPVSK